MSYNDYINGLNSGILRPTCRIEMLNSDESVKSSIAKLPLDSSSLSCNISGGGVVRSISLILDNSNLDFIPSVDSLWMGMKFQLYLGCLDAQGRTIEFPQGLFCLTNSNPQLASLYSTRTVTLNANDKWDLLNVVVGFIYQVPKGSSVMNTIASILTLCGDMKAPIIENLPNDNAPYSMRWDSSATYGTIITDLSNLYSRNVYYNATGNLVLEEFNDQGTVETIFEFSPSQCAYQGNTRTLKYSEMCNHIYVTGATENSTIYRGEAINNDLTSNTRVQLVGDRTELIQDSNLASNDLCNQRAAFELSQKKRMQENISLNSMPLFHADVNKAILVTDPNAGQNRLRYVIQQYQIQLNGKANMTITGFLYSDMTSFLDRTTENNTSATPTT